MKGGPIYLEDLNHDEPEIAALYLYSRNRYIIMTLSQRYPSTRCYWNCALLNTLLESATQLQQETENDEKLA